MKTYISVYIYIYIYGCARRLCPALGGAATGAFSHICICMYTYICYVSVSMYVCVCMYIYLYIYTLFTCDCDSVQHWVALLEARSVIYTYV